VLLPGLKSSDADDLSHIRLRPSNCAVRHPRRMKLRGKLCLAFGTEIDLFLLLRARIRVGRDILDSGCTIAKTVEGVLGVMDGHSQCPYLSNTG
jgi:hypothetical protein